MRIRQAQSVRGRRSKISNVGSDHELRDLASPRSAPADQDRPGVVLGAPQTSVIGEGDVNGNGIQEEVVV